MTAIAPSLSNPFVRTRSTWLGYMLLACFGFALSLVGPIMPFLAAKMGLTFTQIGYHFTLMSVGIVFISLAGDRIAKRIGNDQMVWGAATLFGLALLGVTTGSSLAITLFSMFLFGCAIGAVFLMANTAIAIEAGEHAAKAYIEANIIVGVAIIMGPVLAGLVSRSLLGWQSIAFLPLIYVGILRIFFWGLTLPVALPGKEDSPGSARHVDSRPLPLLFWIFGTLMFLSVAIEWLIGGLGASFLTTVVGFELSTSAALMSVFAVAIVLGRLMGRRLLDYMTESRLLILSLVWVLLTFPLYWLSTLPVLNVAGMFLVGLGVGNLAPLSVSGAMTSAGEATNRASARFGLFPPIAILTMVQLFSILSDQFGIQRAYTFMIVLVIVAIAVAVSTHRLRRTTAYIVPHN
jgi:predicted MFS family arabinose efflux permease